MKRSSHGAKLAALLLGAGLVAAACGSSSTTASSSTAATATTTATTAAAGVTTAAAATTVATTAPAAAVDGGTLTIGAEQEPDCADVINSCGGSSWGYWMMTVGTLPQAYVVAKEGDAYVPKPSSILVGEPTLVT